MAFLADFAMCRIWDVSKMLAKTSKMCKHTLRGSTGGVWCCAYAPGQQSYPQYLHMSMPCCFLQKLLFFSFAALHACFAVDKKRTASLHHCRLSRARDGLFQGYYLRLFIGAEIRNFGKVIFFGFTMLSLVYVCFERAMRARHALVLPFFVAR